MSVDQLFGCLRREFEMITCINCILGFDEKVRHEFINHGGSGAHKLGKDTSQQVHWMNRDTNEVVLKRSIEAVMGKVKWVSFRNKSVKSTLLTSVEKRVLHKMLVLYKLIWVVSRPALMVTKRFSCSPMKCLYNAYYLFKVKLKNYGEAIVNTKIRLPPTRSVVSPLFLTSSVSVLCCKGSNEPCSPCNFARMQRNHIRKQNY